MPAIGSIPMVVAGRPWGSAFHSHPLASPLAVTPPASYYLPTTTVSRHLPASCCCAAVPRLPTSGRRVESPPRDASPLVAVAAPPRARCPCRSPSPPLDGDSAHAVAPSRRLAPVNRGREIADKVCEKFMVGFPYFWESYILGSQASSCKTSKSQDSSTKFYLEKFQLGNFIDKVGCSFIASLLNNAKENTIAFNEGNEGSSAVCNKVGNGKIDLIVESTSKDRDHGVTSTEEFTRDKTSEQAGNQNEFIHPDVEDKEAASHLVNSDSIYDKSTDNLTFGMGDGSTNAGSSVGQGSEEVLATVLPGRANFSSDDCLDNILPISTCNSNNCVENQTCLEIAQHITLNEEVVQNVDMSTSVHSDGESLRNPVGPAKEQISKSDVLQVLVDGLRSMLAQHRSKDLSVTCHPVLLDRQ